MSNKPYKPLKSESAVVDHTLPDAPHTLPVDEWTPELLTAQLMTNALGADTLPRTAALAQLRRRVSALRDPLAPDSLDELARHLPLLEALFQRLVNDALRRPMADDRAKLTRAALQAQQAYARTLALLRTLALQGTGQAAVVLQEGVDDPGI